MLTLPPMDLPGNVHQVAPDNPLRVVRSRRYRASWLAVIDHADPRFDALVSIFGDSPYRPTGTFGVVGLESQEHATLWFGNAAVVADFERQAAAALAAGDRDLRPLLPAFYSHLPEHGVWAERWPTGDGWDDVVPPTTWNPDGQGVLATYDIGADEPDQQPNSQPGGQVVVYELLGRPGLLPEGVTTDPDGPVPTLAWHCTRCHRGSDYEPRYVSTSPEDRTATCRKARAHLQPGRCAGSAGLTWDDRMVAVVESVATGRPQVADTAGLYASRCQTRPVHREEVVRSSSCAEVGEARTHTARHHSGTRR